MTSTKKEPVVVVLHLARSRGILRVDGPIR